MADLLRRRELSLSKRSGLPPVLGWAGLLIVALITGYPLLKLLLQMGQFDGRPSLEGFGAVFTDARYLTPFRNTLIVGVSTTVISLCLGVPLALVAGRMDIPGGKVLRVLLMVPYLIPGFVFAFAWREMIGPVGYVNQAYKALAGSQEPLLRIYGPLGVILVLSLHGCPMVYITVVRSLQNMNASFEEAAEVAGARGLTMLRTITLPLMLPSILGAALLVFATSIANFGVAAVLGIPASFYVLTTQIYATVLSYGVKNNLTIASCLSVYLIATGLLFLWVQERMVGRRRHVVITGKGGRKDLLPPGPKAWLYSSVIGTFCFVTVVLPLAAILLSSFTRAYGLPPSLGNLTLGNYTALPADKLVTASLRNSLVFGVITATVCVAVGMVIALVTERSSLAGRRFLDFLATAPRSIPGTIIALAFIIAWIRPIPILRVSIYNTALIMILAYVARFLGYAVRTLTASLKQIAPSLEEACLVSGGKHRHRVFDVLVPLSREGIASGWLLIFIPTLNELTISILLYSSGKETIGVAVFSLLQEGSIGRASAFSIVIIVTVLLGDRLVALVSRGRRSLLG